MDRYKVFPSGEMGMHPAGNWTPYADAQATVEALRAQLPAEMQECTILFKECEKGHGRLTATNWIDHGCQTCAMEALQRERKQAEQKHLQDVAYMRSQYDSIVAMKDEVQAALDTEREKVKGLHEITKVICTHCCEPMEIPSKAVLQTQLTQLQALVRALPVVRIDLNGAYHDTLLAQPEDDAVKELLRYRATLDATTPAAKLPAWVNEAMRHAPTQSKGGDGE